MPAIMLVDDDEGNRAHLAKKLRDEHPEARIDEANNLADAIDLARWIADEGSFYDVALLDVNLPKDRDDTNHDKIYPNSRRRLLASLGHRSVVLNYSAKANIPEIRQQINEMREPNAPVPVLIQRGFDSLWEAELLKLTRRTIFGRRIAAQLDRMRAERSESPRLAGVAAYRGQASDSLDGTQGLGALARDIKLHWADLDDELRRRIKSVFDIREASGQLLVNL
jgi:CheY-like chemotaxis protein